MDERNHITLDKIKKRIIYQLQDYAPADPIGYRKERAQGMETIKEKMASLILRIPVVSNIARWTYRFIALPWRVERIDQKTDALISYMDGLHGKLDDLNRKLDTIKPVIHAGDNIIVTKVDEFIMGFPSEEWRLVAYHVFHGQLEPGLTKVFRKYVKSGMVVVDVGANVGAYTLIAATLVGDNGKVYSFEPTPRTFDILHDNVQVNGLLETNRVVFTQMAVMDKKSKAKFSVYAKNSGHNTLFPNSDDQNIIEVETDSLDRVLHDVPRIDIVKIDAEGAEPFVLRGMQNIIKKNPHIVIFMEFAPGHLRRAGVDVKEFIGEIKNYGFSVRKVGEPSGEILSISDQELLQSLSVNVMLEIESEQ